MELDERPEVDPGHTNDHACTNFLTEHPGRYRYDLSRGHLQVNQLARRASLAVVTVNPSAAKRMPGVVDDRRLPEMGRMTLRR